MTLRPRNALVIRARPPTPSHPSSLLEVRIPEKNDGQWCGSATNANASCCGSGTTASYVRRTGRPVGRLAAATAAATASAGEPA